MNENLRHWEALGKTDPAHTKIFKRAGGFSGTAIKPIWTEYRLTERFGPCGVGWGCDEPIFNLVPAGDELLVYCTLRCWYMEEGKPASLYGVGGDKVLVKRQSGVVTDDEAYKKSFTDALGNAFKHIGAGADVHMGLFDDSKYVSEMRREFADEAAPTTTPVSAGVDPFAPPVKAPHPNAAKAEQERKRIKASLLEADKKVAIDGIIAANGPELKLIRDVHAPAYEALMSLAEKRTQEFQMGA